jgi:hypothetical protein
VRNADQRAKTLIVEHAVRPQYKVLNQKPIETTASAYRFQVPIAAGATVQFPVTEEREFDNSFQITSMNPPLLADYIQNKTLSDNARKQLEAIARQKRLIADTDTAYRQTEADINNLIRDQERLRQNIMSLNQVSGQQDQVQKYARSLATQEATLASLRDRQSELVKNKTALEAELNSLIEKMEF